MSATCSQSMSPFCLRHSCMHERFPIGVLPRSDIESDTELTWDCLCSAPPSDDKSQGGGFSDNESDSEEESPDNDQFNPLTEANTEANSLVSPDVAKPDPLEISDLLGEGINVIVPPKPYFPTTLNHSSLKNPCHHKSTCPEPLQLQTGWPIFQCDRCMISLTQGDPECALKTSGHCPQRHVIMSNLSDESWYAVEWGTGTVLSDGDEM